MTYFQYHNEHKDAKAQYMFDRNYTYLTRAAQQMVDDRIKRDYKKLNK